jgi:recombinational DNA repair protein RecT
LLKLHKAVKKLRIWSRKKILTHIQEFDKVFNEIIPLTTFLEASVEG